MASQTSDRLRTRSDLQELAKLAKPVAGGPGPGFDTADSSGYVDLSAFSAQDAGWVDRELARARNGAPPPPPSSRARAIDALQPESMIPVALEAMKDPEKTASVRTSPARKAFYGMSGLASVVVVAFLAVAMAKHPPPAGNAPVAAAAAPVAPPVTPDPAVQPPVTAAAAAPPVAAATTTVAATPVAAPVTLTPARATRRTAPAVHAVAAAPAAAPTPAQTHVAAAKPVVIPPSKPAGGSDSLMDLIKKSVATGK